MKKISFVLGLAFLVQTCSAGMYDQYFYERVPSADVYVKYRSATQVDIRVGKTGGFWTYNLPQTKDLICYMNGVQITLEDDLLGMITLLKDSVKISYGSKSRKYLTGWINKDNLDKLGNDEWSTNDTIDFRINNDGFCNIHASSKNTKIAIEAPGIVPNLRL